jgi:hypothetical protein
MVVQTWETCLISNLNLNPYHNYKSNHNLEDNHTQSRHLVSKPLVPLHLLYPSCHQEEPSEEGIAGL